MAKKMLIDATHAEETRVVVVDGNKVEEFDFETVNKRQLQGNIYLAKVTRVEPSLQAAFVDYGGNRHGFLAFAEIHPDYYQIPVADRQALLAEERAYAEAMEAEEARGPRRRRPAPRAEASQDGAAVSASDAIPGMAVVDLEAEAESAEAAAEAAAAPSGDSPAGERSDEPYVAADHASETDDDIESIAEEDVAEEIRQPRKPRPRRYKIQEVVKVRQIMLVQVVKEERGNKGAALTTYLSLAGRYCVLMPNTARGGGISRKITNAVDRKKLKEIAGEMEVPEGAGLIIRTAGSQRTKTEIKRDYEYLMRLWEQIRDLTLRSIAPAPIYEEGDLIKRSIRDLYNKDIDEVLVEGEKGYRAAKDFMKMIMPSHAKNVKLYNEPLPLFARYQVETYLAGMFNPVVQLKSGGYIVIGVTEALVAIDVNSGRATKEGSIEETALKTNLEAAEEIARQLRLRDLAGLIVIDFIDMEERKNNAAVEKRLKEKLKTDRARIQVGRISGFGLLEMSRQRLRPGMLESTTQPCSHCHGTGIIRSDDSLALQILRQLEEEGTRKRSREVLLRAPVAVVNFLMNQKREHIGQIEARFGLSVRIEADPSLISPDYVIDKFKTATRIVPEPTTAVVSANASLMADIDEDLPDEDEVEEAEEAVTAPEGEGPKKKKRRRRRKR
ncbi:MAG: Rne/Rng family ribonuclease, partial [Pseudomonadota bacterium]